MIADIVVREHGTKGPAVVVLHGGPGAQGSVTSLAGTLARNYRVLEPLQRRGGGKVALSVEGHVTDLAQVAPERAVYVGWSWGAMLGLSFAATHPGRVSSLVLVGCGTYDESSREIYVRNIRRLLGEEGSRRLEDLEQRLARATDVTWRDDVLGQMGELIERASAVARIGSLAEDTHPDAAGHEETWTDVLRLQHEGVEPARFSSVGCPVLMLHGEQDPHPGPQTRDLLQRCIPHLAYIAIPRCGHVPWEEKYGRDPFLEHVHAWISDVR